MKLPESLWSSDQMAEFYTLIYKGRLYYLQQGNEWVKCPESHQVSNDKTTSFRYAVKQDLPMGEVWYKEFK